MLLPTQQGSFRLFRLAGIQVCLHWSWFLVAAYIISSRVGNYSSPVWNALEYLSLFAIVLMHEFGHALACRQTGGQASEIVLWPLGGVAYVQPPQRPGATLWSIAAGPLVNVLLVPVLGAVLWFATAQGFAGPETDLGKYLRILFIINGVLLVFNLLPVYPLDGGQILWALLWFIMGRARALLVASTIGLIGVAGLFLVALALGSIWLIIMCVFVLMNCWRALKYARQLAQAEAVPRQDGVVCPECGAAPPAGAYWMCARCSKPFDTFASDGVCPFCQTVYESTACPHCRRLSPLSDWRPPPVIVPPRLRE